MTKKQVKKSGWVDEDISSKNTDPEEPILDNPIEEESSEDPAVDTFTTSPFLPSSRKKEEILVALDGLRGSIKLGTFDDSALETLWIIVSKMTNEGKNFIEHVAKYVAK